MDFETLQEKNFCGHNLYRISCSHKWIYSGGNTRIALKRSPPQPNLTLLGKLNRFDGTLCVRRRPSLKLREVSITR